MFIYHRSFRRICCTSEYEFHGQNEKKWGNHSAHHDADLKCPPLGGIVFNGKIHEGRIDVFHNDFPNLAREVEKVESHPD